MLVLHLVNRLLAAVLSVVVIAAAGLTTVEVVRWALGMTSWLVPWGDWGQTLSTITADDGRLLVVSGLAAGLGLLLLVFELRRRRPDSLPARPLLEGVSTVVTRKGAASAASTAARNVSGVTTAKAGVRRGTVSLDVGTRARGEAEALASQVRSAVQKSLDDLELVRSPRIKVDVKEAG